MRIRLHKEGVRVYPMGDEEHDRLSAIASKQRKGVHIGPQGRCLVFAFPQERQRLEDAIAHLVGRGRVRAVMALVVPRMEAFAQHEKEMVN